MQTIENIFLGLWVFILVFGLALVLYFNWQTVKIWYLKNEGKIYLALTFTIIALLLIILDFINLIKLV
ncbi:MAG: hypothetical protein ABFD07_06395 [Methanobacterium sp.]